MSFKFEFCVDFLWILVKDNNKGVWNVRRLVVIFDIDLNFVKFLFIKVKFGLWIRRLYMCLKKKKKLEGYMKGGYLFYSFV